MQFFDKYKKMSPMPDVGDFIFVFVIWIALFVLPSMLFVDGSTGWHLVAGNYILDNFSVPYTDLNSFTYADKDWVAYEWLFDAGAAALVRMGGTNLLAVALACMLGFIFVYIYDKCRESGSNIILSSFFTVVAILVSAIHWLARPHVFTYIFVLIFIASLNGFYQDKLSKKSLFITLVVTMLFWTNIHPSFAMGCIVTLIYFVVLFFQSFLSSEESIRLKAKSKAITLFLLMAACTLITLVNPYGIKLHVYIIEYLQGQEIIKGTNEFMSPVFHGGLHETCLEILFLAFISGLALRKKLTTPMLLVCLAFAHAALAGIRSMPMFAIVATPAIAYLWSSNSTTVKSTSPDSSPLKKTFKLLCDFQEQEAKCKMHLVPIAITIAFTVIALNGGMLFGNKVINSGFAEKHLPVKALEYIKNNSLTESRGLNLDNWGGYLRYKLDHRVFIDDRADFYEYKFYYDYSRMMSAAEDYKELLNKYKIEWVLFPKNSQLANKLRENKNWQEVASDRASALFRKIK